MKPPPRRIHHPPPAGFSIRRWIEGCEALGIAVSWLPIRYVSVSADGSKGVKQCPMLIPDKFWSRFSIRRWIEGCEADFGTPIPESP